MKILASDYDGTLRVNEKVESYDLDMIHKHRAAGNLFGLVTGRSMESIKAEIEGNGIEVDFVIANNGGVIYDKQFQKLRCIYMDTQAAQEIIAYIKSEECASYVINDGYHRHKYIGNEAIEDVKYGNIPTHAKDEVYQGMIAQLVVSLQDDNLAHTIAAYINQNFSAYAVAYVNVNCVDIVPVGISKADGITYLKERYGWEKENIYVIGDSYNDLPMLNAFHGFTLFHAKDEIKANAEAVFAQVGDCIKALQA